MENRSCQEAELEQREEAQRGCSIGQQKEHSLDEELGSWRMNQAEDRELCRSNLDQEQMIRAAPNGVSNDPRGGHLYRPQLGGQLG